VCDRMVKLPMHGHASSLNLSVAAGVLLYAMMEQDPSN
jgi:tRNA G18 (ribose-2'-O)-methylase SpoU